MGLDISLYIDGHARATFPLTSLQTSPYFNENEWTLSRKHSPVSRDCATFSEASQMKKRIIDTRTIRMSVKSLAESFRGGCFNKYFPRVFWKHMKTQRAKYFLRAVPWTRKDFQNGNFMEIFFSPLWRSELSLLFGAKKTEET